MNNSRLPDIESAASPPRRDLEYADLEMGEVIGSGGQAVVSEAEISTENGPERLAVKQPSRDAQTLPRETIDRFLEEAQTWATVDKREREKTRWRSSEHIVGVIDFGDRLPWIAIEYMDGGGLQDRLEAQPGGIELDEALWIGECVCRGIEVAHSYGIAHLDIKPANVLFRETPGEAWDVPKVADWGLARTLADQTGTMDRLSVEYAAPEQFDPDSFGDPDMLTDVYQVGALVYALLAGQPPYTGTQLSLMNDVLSDSPPDPLSEHRGDVPEALDRIVLRALEREKTNRYRAVGMFLEELTTIRADVPSDQREMSKGTDRKDSITGGSEPSPAGGASSADNRGTKEDDTLSENDRGFMTDDGKETVHGAVASINDTGGYGFVETDVLGDDVFFHMGDVASSEVTEGQEVLVEVENGFRGPWATVLTPLSNRRNESDRDAPCDSSHTEHRGVVDFFNDTGGYGFIESQTVDEAVFFHIEDVPIPDLAEGQEVVFEFAHTKHGPRATNVSRL